MCTYISYIFPGELPAQRVSEAMRSIYRDGVVSCSNPFLDRDLNAGETAWICRNGCDCGTWIGAGPEREEDDVGGEIKAVKLRRKGWSEAKIQRALTDSHHIAIQHRHDDVDFNKRFIADLAKAAAALQAPYMKLFWHNYSGLLDDEKLVLRPVKLSDKISLELMLTDLPEDSILMIPSGVLMQQAAL